MAKPKTFIISLAEPVALIKDSFREQLAYMLLNRDPEATKVACGVNYNCVPYLTQLLNEIFAAKGNPEVFGQLSPSTRILIQDGLHRETAIQVALLAFDVVVRAITSIFPNLHFGDTDSFQYDLCGEASLYMTPPLGYLEEQLALVTH